MKDRSGQVALEYILIFTISLILLIVFTLPLAEITIQNTLDVSDTLDVKSDLSSIAGAIQKVYGQGQGSKQSVSIISSKNLKVTVSESYVSSNVKLRDASDKIVKVDCASNIVKSNFYISKGDNMVIVDWPDGSEKIRIYVE